MPSLQGQPDHARIVELADRVAPKLTPGADFSKEVSAVLRGVKDANERTALVSAIAHELGIRAHLNDARRRPDAPARETTPTPRNESREQKQEGFGFGEATGPKLRPPTRRHL